MCKRYFLRLQLKWWGVYAKSSIMRSSLPFCWQYSATLSSYLIGKFSALYASTTIYNSFYLDQGQKLAFLNNNHVAWLEHDVASMSFLRYVKFLKNKPLNYNDKALIQHGVFLWGFQRNLWIKGRVILTHPSIWIMRRSNCFLPSKSLNISKMGNISSLKTTFSSKMGLCNFVTLYIALNVYKKWKNFLRGFQNS